MTISVHCRSCARVGSLLVLCAVVPGASATQPNAESSNVAHTTVRGPSEASAAWLVNSDQGLAIIGAALESRHTDANADCSNLVHEIYVRAGFIYSYANSSELYQGIKEFRRVMHPQPGDLVVWRGHVGIVISPSQHSFFSAMRSGRGVEFYDSPYWQGRGQPRFLHYVKAASQNQWSASTRKTGSKPGVSRNTDAHDLVAAGESSGAVSGSAQTDAGSSAGERGGDESATGSLRAEAVAPAKVSGVNPPAASPPVEGPQEAAQRKPENQTAPDALSAIDPNRPATTRRKIQGPGDGVWETTATKPSAGIPFDPVAALPPPPEPRPSQSLRTLNMAAKAGQTGGRLPAASGAPVKESRPELVQWAMSRYVPRPPWSLPKGSNSAPVPRPLGRRTARVPAFYVPTVPVR
jgi:NlpC/P60 family protein